MVWRSKSFVLSWHQDSMRNVLIQDVSCWKQAGIDCSSAAQAVFSMLQFPVPASASERLPKPSMIDYIIACQSGSTCVRAASSSVQSACFSSLSSADEVDKVSCPGQCGEKLTTNSVRTNRGIATHTHKHDHPVSLRFTPTRCFRHPFSTFATTHLACAW